jgi:Zn-dependent peptidase ImmA (M78 family)
MNVLRAEASAQAERMLEVLDQDWPRSRERLQDDALTELGRWQDIQVRTVPDSQADRRCSVAGGYVHTTTPPTLTVTMSLSTRRQCFTALHELGHHLQKNDIDLAVAVRAQRADITDFEDAACDAFAARVLLPDDLLPVLVSGRSPTAADIAGLFERSRASRAACCVRIAERVAGHGVITLLDHSGKVLFAVGRGDIFPPARGSDQSRTPLVCQALQEFTNTRHDCTHILYRNGSTSAALYGDAAWCDDYLVTVAVTDRPGWKAFAPPRPGTGKVISGYQEWCELCEEEFSAVDRCDRCRQPRCPVGHCGCTAARERMCQQCFLKKPPSQFATPTTDICTECSD